MQDNLRIVTVSEMLEIEKEANQKGLTYDQMMENAGRGLGVLVNKLYEDLSKRGVLGLVGSGNNGGDTLVALDQLINLGWDVKAYIVKAREQKDPLMVRLKKSGGDIYLSENDSNLEVLQNLIKQNKVLLDGVFGTGIKLPLRGRSAEILKVAKNIILELDDKPIVVAVDCPSGVDCDTGEVAEETISANTTVTMAAVKEGLLKFPATLNTGLVRVVDIGLSGDLKKWADIKRFMVDKVWVKKHMPLRPPDAHKGTFGTALITAGCENYTGAALLAGKAAYLSGTGLVTLAVPRSVYQSIAGQFPESTWLILDQQDGFISEKAIDIIFDNINRATALLIGPGFGLHNSPKKFINKLINKKTSIFPPLVIDADGLKLLSVLPDWFKSIPKNSILTPHPGEMSILTGLNVKHIQSKRFEIATKYAYEWQLNIVLKGANTIIASPDGRQAVVPVATAALARAGTGDVLAGLIVGFCAQGVELFDAAVLGAWIHAQAGLISAKNLGSTACVLASDLWNSIIPVMQELLE